MAPPNRPADLPKSTNDTACFFFWLQKYSWMHLAFSWHQLVKIPLIFVPSQRIENRWTLDGKTSFFRWFWFKRKELKNVRFLAWKTSEKRLFYRLNRNSFMFRLFGMLHRQIAKNKPGPTSDQKMPVPLLYRADKELAWRALGILPAKMRHTSIASSGREGIGAESG